MTNFGHVPVLKDEVLEILQPVTGGRFGDLTLGAGGHAEAICERIGETGRLWAFDRDPSALAIAEERLARFEEQVTFVKFNFEGAASVLEHMGVDGLDGALMDLGVSSMQLDDPDRGFAFREDGPLDMRMGQKGKRTAAFLIDTLSAEELEAIFRDFGEEPRARDIARKIVDLRRRTKIRRTTELAELVRSVTGSRGKIHPATRVFQGLRIAVNRELEVLEIALPRILGRLRSKGRLAVISFHSLEDRIVKDFFRRMEKEGEGRVLTPKPILATKEEERRNRRARSARMRGLEKR